MKIDILVKFCTFSFWLQFQRDTPHLQIKSSLYVCRSVQGSQIFKQNWIILIHLRVIAFLLISWSPHPRGPHIVPMVWMLSPCCSHMSPSFSLSPHGSHTPMAVVSMVSTPWCFHIIPIIPTSSPHHLEGPHIIPNPPDTHYTHPHPQEGGPESVKIQYNLN